MKQDRRVQKTEQLYQEALLELLKNKSIHQISITELSAYAHVHRATFYTHYKGIDELLYSIEKEMIQKLEAIFQDVEQDSFHDVPYSVLYDIFCFLDQYRKIMGIFFMRDAYFVSEMKRMLTMYCGYSCQQRYRQASKEEYDFLVSYMVEGMVFVFKEWVYTNKQQETPDTMAWRLQRVMLLGMQALEK